MTEAPRNNAPKTRGRPFERGNPGRPRGARHKTSLAIEALLQGEAEKLTRAAIDKALEGDVTALRLCLDRLAPARRDAPVTFALPRIETADEAASALSAILQAVASGYVTPTEGESVARLVAAFVQALEAKEFEARLAKLEREDRR